jgi:AhpD family alkylhydroperoxidase
MNVRLDWTRINPDAYKGFLAAAKSTTSLDRRLKNLIEVRVSQMNGCAFCLDMHCRDAREAGERQERLDCLAGWRDAPFFSDRERAALDWAEALTRIAESHAPDEVFDRLKPHFSEREIVDLTVAITVINSWNRTQISMRIPPRERRE